MIEFATEIWNLLSDRHVCVSQMSNAETFSKFEQIYLVPACIICEALGEVWVTKVWATKVWDARTAL